MSDIPANAVVVEDTDAVCLAFDSAFLTPLTTIFRHSPLSTRRQTLGW